MRDGRDPDPAPHDLKAAWNAVLSWFARLLHRANAPFGSRGRASGRNRYFMFYTYLRSQYCSVAEPLRSNDRPPSEAAAAASAKQQADRVVQKWDENPNAVSFTDLISFERAIVQLQPEEDLRRRAWQLRERLQALVGEQLYATYVDSDPPKSGDATVGELRSDLEQVLDTIHWCYTSTAFREREQSRVLKKTARWIVIFAAGVLLSLAYDVWSLPPTDAPAPAPPRPRPIVSLVPLVLFMGVLGAFVSLQQRFKSIRASGDPMGDALALRHGQTSVYLSPVFGALFALLTYLVLVSGLVQSNLLPALAEYPEDVMSEDGKKERDERRKVAPLTGLRWAIPASAGDLARLLLLAFVAGFAERLIPDTLDRMIGKRIAHFEGPAPRGRRRTQAEGKGGPTGLAGASEGSRSHYEDPPSPPSKPP